MTQKLWSKCKKCGCDKPEDSSDLLQWEHATFLWL